MKDDEFYNIDDICRLFRVSKITVYRWLKAKKIIGYKMGKAYLFKKADIDKFIEESKV
jgi:excisionase family DNA binding protein